MSENLQTFFENFDANKITQFFKEEEDKKTPTYDKIVKYVSNNAIYTNNGRYFFQENGITVWKKEIDFHSIYLGCLSAKLVSKCIKQQREIYQETAENKNYFIDRKTKTINFAGEIYAKSLTCESTTESKKYLKFFREEYLKEIFCKDDKTKFDYIEKWIASLIQGRKLKIAVVSKNVAQGIGKTTLAEILVKLLGVQNIHRPSITELEQFNMGLFGKRFSILEETKGIASSNAFENVKNLITNDLFSFVAKGLDAKMLNNITSFFISSNYSLPDEGGRRFVYFSPSTDWANVMEKWDKIYDLNDEKIKELYNFYANIDVNNWCETKASKMLINEDTILKKIDNMPISIRFLKEEYTLKKKSINISGPNFYEHYQNWVNSQKNAVKYILKKGQFINEMLEFGIKQQTAHDKLYIIDHKEIYDKLKQLQFLEHEEKERYNKENETDDETSEEDDNTNEEIEQLKQDFEKEKEMYKNLLAEKEKEITDLKKLLEAKPKINIIDKFEKADLKKLKI